MKTLIITPNFNGKESWMRCAVNTAEILNEQGHIVTILTTNTEGQVDYERWSGLHIYRITSKMLPDPLNLSIPNIILFLKALDRLVSKYNFHSVIINKSWFVTSLLASVYLRWKRIKYFVQLDTMVGKIWFGTNKLMNLAMWIYARSFNRFILGGAEKCIVYHEGLVPVMEDWKLDYSVVSQGVDFKKYKCSSKASDVLHFKNNRVCFLFVGRLDDIKRWQEYLEVCKRVKEKRGNVCFVFVCGNKHREKRKELQNKYKDMKFYGFRDDVDRVMKACDVLVLPSKCEGMPDVIMEAQSSGLCCIASNVGGIKSLIKDKVNGYLFEDFKELEVKMLRLVDFKARREHYANEALKSVRKHDKKLVGQKLNALLSSIQL